jgi:hypothetical protein
MNKVGLYCNFEFYSIKNSNIFKFNSLFDINKGGLYRNFEFYSLKNSIIYFRIHKI